MQSASLVRRLSAPREDRDALEAALEVLRAADVAEQVDRLYPGLVRHKTLLTALAHLQRAGGDIDGLTVSGDLVRTVWPLGALLPGLQEGIPVRVSLSRMQTLLEEHARRLDQTLIDLLARAPTESFLVLAGRAMGAAYPSYRNRLGYDLDVLAPEVDSGLEIVAELEQSLGFALIRSRLALVDGEWLGVFQTFRVDQDGYEIHVDVMIRGHPAGPGLLPLWFRPPMVERARKAEIRGRTVLVPSAEDMLLLMAVRQQRKRAFTHRDINDAWCLLSSDRATMDWEEVCSSSGRHHVAGVLFRLATEVEALSGERLVPPRVLQTLEPHGLERRLVAVARSPRHARSLLRRAWPLVWSFRYRREEVGWSRALRELWANRRKARAFLLSIRWSRSHPRVTRFAASRLAGLHRGLGSLCEVREVPAGEGGGPCLSRDPLRRAGILARQPPDVRRVLEAAARTIPEPAQQLAPRVRPSKGAPSRAHRCRAFLFSVEAPRSRRRVAATR
ncbi:MAG: nucleotidyltransferase family protein [Actinobacteria bacterium]|nr:nucleotidyltransferase family protein [Actinomycetota bacterium]